MLPPRRKKWPRAQAPSWEDIVNAKPTEEEENWDGEDSQSATAHQFEDVIIEEVIESVTEEEVEPPVTGELLTQLGEVAGSSMGQKDMPSHAGEVQS